MAFQASALRGIGELFGEKGIGIGALGMGTRELGSKLGGSARRVADVLALQKGVGTWATGAGVLTMGTGLLATGDENRGWMGVGAQVGAGYAMLRGGMGLRRGFGSAMSGVTPGMKRTTTKLLTSASTPPPFKERVAGLLPAPGGTSMTMGVGNIMDVPYSVPRAIR